MEEQTTSEDVHNIMSMFGSNSEDHHNYHTQSDNQMHQLMKKEGEEDHQENDDDEQDHNANGVHETVDVDEVYQHHHLMFSHPGGEDATHSAHIILAEMGDHEGEEEEVQVEGHIGSVMHRHQHDDEEDEGEEQDENGNSLRKKRRKSQENGGELVDPHDLSHHHHTMSLHSEGHHDHHHLLNNHHAMNMVHHSTDMHGQHHPHMDSHSHMMMGNPQGHHPHVIVHHFPHPTGGSSSDSSESTDESIEDDASNHSHSMDNSNHHHHHHHHQQHHHHYNNLRASHNGGGGDSDYTPSIGMASTTTVSSATGIEFWNSKYNELKEFKRVHGHISPCYISHPQLYSWLHRQKFMHRKNKLSYERQQLLQELGVHFEYHWDEMYQMLKEYKDRHGTVVVDHQQDSKLNYWVWSQIYSWKSGKMTEERVAKLEELGLNKDMENDVKPPKLPAKKKKRRHTSSSTSVSRLDSGNNGDMGGFQGSNESFSDSDSLSNVGGNGNGMMSHHSSGTIGSNGGGTVNSARGKAERKSDQNWIYMYGKLKEFKDEHMTVSVPIKVDKKLNLWIRTQRKSYREGRLAEWKFKKLVKMGLNFPEGGTFSGKDVRDDDDDDDGSYEDPNNHAAAAHHHVNGQVTHPMHAMQQSPHTHHHQLHPHYAPHPHMNSPIMHQHNTRHASRGSPAQGMTAVPIMQTHPMAHHMLPPVPTYLPPPGAVHPHHLPLTHHLTHPHHQLQHIMHHPSLYEGQMILEEPHDASGSAFIKQEQHHHHGVEEHPGLHAQLGGDE